MFDHGHDWAIIVDDETYARCLLLERAGDKSAGFASKAFSSVIERGDQCTTARMRLDEFDAGFNFR